jgi:hypothetical protein
MIVNFFAVCSPFFLSLPLLPQPTLLLPLVHLCRPLFSGPKTVQASVTLLEQLPVLLDKVTQTDLQQEVLPMVYLALESHMSQVQVRAGFSCPRQTFSQ